MEDQRNRDILHQHCNAIYNLNTIDKWTKEYILSFAQKGDPKISKNYRGITITSIVANIYNALLCNHIEPKIEKIFRKNQNGCWKNRSMTSQILNIGGILECIGAKNLQETILFIVFSRPLTLYTEGRKSRYFPPTAYPNEQP